MNKKAILLFFALSLIFISCNPVRNSTIRFATKDKKNNNESEENNLSLIRDNRFIDTTIIKLPDIVDKESESEDDTQNNTYNNEYNKIFKEAVSDLDNNNFELAYQKLNNLKSTLSTNDSLYFECDFYMAECMVSQNKLNDAKKIFDLLETNENAPEVVLEKTLVRLGQIYCQKNDKKTAASYFSKLEMLNPKSIYLKVANCNFLDKRAK